MNNQTMTLEEIRLFGIEVLSKHLGKLFRKDPEVLTSLKYLLQINLLWIPYF